MNVTTSRKLAEKLDGRIEDDEDYYYCVMWDILHDISSPVIHGRINEDTITRYLSELENEYRC